MTHRLSTTLVLLGAMLCISPAVAAAKPKRPPKPISVPVTIVGGQGTPMGARPIVKVRVGNSKPVPVLLDTGSTGLQIFAPAVKQGPGSGVKTTTRRDSITYSGGNRFRGVVATALIKLAGHATAGRIPFGLVQSASCVPAKPTCGAAGGVSKPMSDGTWGVLGIGLSPGGNGLYSPILGMAGRLGHTWSLNLAGRSGTLRLGASMPPAARTAATIQLRSRGMSGPHPAWADNHVRLCDTFGAIADCVPGLFDSGTPATQLRGQPLNAAPTVSGTNRLIPGTPVTVSLPGSARPFWSYAAGLVKSKNAVTVKPGQGSPFVIYGVDAFYAFRITYDEVNGRMALVPTG